MVRRVFEKCDSCGFKCIPPARPGVPERAVCIPCEKKPQSIAQFSGDFSVRPIVEEEVTDMKAQTQVKPAKIRTVKAAAPAELPVSDEAVIQTALEYQEMKADLERVTANVSKLGDFLKKHLPAIDGKAIEVSDGKILYLCEPDPSKSFDLEAAEETLAKDVLKMLSPFIKTTRELKLDAAEKLIDMTPFKKFIVKKPNSPSLRFKDKKEA